MSFGLDDLLDPLERRIEAVVAAGSGAEFYVARRMGKGEFKAQQPRLIGIRFNVENRRVKVGFKKDVPNPTDLTVGGQVWVST